MTGADGVGDGSEGGGTGGEFGGETGAAPGFLSRIALTFAAPSQIFAAIDRAPGSWWQPLLLIAILNGVLVHLTYDRVIVPSQIAAMEERGVEAEELAQAKTFILSGAARGLALGGAVLGTPIAALVSALVIHLVAGFLLGGSAGFTRTWAVVCQSLLISLPEDAAKVPIMIADQSTQVSFGPALLLSPGEPSRFLFNLISQIDAFTIWKVVLVGLGLATVHRISRGSAITACLVIWGLWAVGAASFAGLMRR